jgi:hypothetical protein
MIVSIVVTKNLNSIAQAWKLLLVTGAGTGTVLMLRWFWWRINAWSEVSAMAVAAVVSLDLQKGLNWNSDTPKEFAYIMLVTVGITTATWLAVTYLTRPEPEDKLIAFYRHVRPDGPGWKRIAIKAGVPAGATGSLGPHLLNWVLGCVLIYASLFGIGKLIFKQWLVALIYLAVAGLSALAISRTLSEAGWTGSPANEAEPDPVAAAKP